MSGDGLTDEQRGLLEQWADGELAGDRERRAEELVASRAAARSYVDALDTLGTASRTGFDEAALDAPPSAEELAERAVEAPPLSDCEVDDLAPLLDRFADGEVTEAEARSIRRLREQRANVDAYVRTLEGLSEAVRTAFDEASPPAHWSPVSEADLESRQGGDPAGAADTPTPRGAGQPRSRPADSAGGDDRESRTEGPPQHGSGLGKTLVGVGAAAAIVLSLLALFDVDPFGGGPTSTTAEKEKIVVVERVQHSPGKSVVVRGRNRARSGGTAEPTVIWMLNEDGDSTARDGPATESPTTPGPSEGRPAPDAGRSVDGGPEGLQGEPEPI